MDGGSYARAFANMGVALVVFGALCGLIIAGLGFGGWALISHLRWQ